MSAASEKTLDGAGSAPLTLPQELRDSMFPDETIIWMQKGQGARWPLVYTAPPVLMTLMCAFFFWLMMGELDGKNALGTAVFLGIFLLGALSVQITAAAGTIFGPRSEYCVLTDERVLHHRSFPTHSTRALVVRGAGFEIDREITYIAVWGNRARGWIMLRSEEYRTRPFQFQLFPHYATSLVGVENPLQVAALIKSTLSLDFEIEDHTR